MNQDLMGIYRGVIATGATGAARDVLSKYINPHVFGRSCVMTSFGADQKYAIAC